MGHCYSLDLRVRVADFVAAGHSCRAAARHFAGRRPATLLSATVSPSSSYGEHGIPAPRRPPAKAARPGAASSRPMRRF